MPRPAKFVDGCTRCHAVGQLPLYSSEAAYARVCRLVDDLAREALGEIAAMARRARRSIGQRTRRDIERIGRG